MKRHGVEDGSPYGQQGKRQRPDSYAAALAAGNTYWELMVFLCRQQAVLLVKLATTLNEFVLRWMICCLCE
jgi:hypothetical protein